MVCAETVAECFDAMYYLEQAARITVKALSTGQKLKIVDDKVWWQNTYNFPQHALSVLKAAARSLCSSVQG